MRAFPNAAMLIAALLLISGSASGQVGSCWDQCLKDGDSGLQCIGLSIAGTLCERHPVPGAMPSALTPPPPPPPAGCSHEQAIVYFDWDSVVVGKDAAAILDVVLEHQRSCGGNKIHLDGYTDRSGSEAYNMSLSERRNAAVTRYLAIHDFSEAKIESAAFGESNQRVPTANGVRELQNRRVEITID